MSYANATPTTTFPSGNTKNWNTYQVEIRGHIVRFRAPPYESSDHPEFKVPSKIDVENAKTFHQNNRGPNLLWQHWDYRKNRFVTNYGTLDALIRVNRSEVPLSDMEDLLNAISRNHDLNHRADEAEAGRSVFFDPIVHTETCEIGGKRALLVEYKVAKGIYYVPLDSELYLSVSFDADGVTEPGLREDAQDAANQMLHSIRIDEK